MCEIYISMLLEIIEKCNNNNGNGNNENGISIL